MDLEAQGEDRMNYEKMSIKRLIKEYKEAKEKRQLAWKGLYGHERKSELDYFVYWGMMMRMKEIKEILEKRGYNVEVLE